MQHSLRRALPGQRAHPAQLARLALWLAASLPALILAWLAGPSAAAEPAPAEAATLVEAGNLAADGDLARKRGVPLLVLYSRADCSWCERLRREFLAPMQRDPATGALIRQIDIDSDRPLADWEGRATTHRKFAEARDVRLAPTVAFFGPRGETLAQPMIGFPGADFISGLLERGIADATARLRGTPAR